MIFSNKEKEELKELTLNIHKIKNKNVIPKINSTSLNVCIDIVAGFTTWGFIGYQLDKFFKTKIIFFVVCVILSSITSLFVIYRNYKD